MCFKCAYRVLPRRSQFTRWTQQRVRAGLLNARCPSCHDLRAKVSTPEHLVLIGPRSIRHTPDNLPTKQPAPAACSCKPQAETVRVQMLAVMWWAPFWTQPGLERSSVAAAPSDAARSISSFVGSIYKISPELKSVTVRLSENVTSSATNRAKKNLWARFTPALLFTTRGSKRSLLCTLLQQVVTIILHNLRAVAE